MIAGYGASTVRAAPSGDNGFVVDQDRGAAVARQGGLMGSFDLDARGYG